MSQPDSISIAIPEAEMTAIKAAISSLQASLGPYLQTLSPSERQEIPKMGEKSFAFVQKAFEYSQQYPDLVPGYLDTAALSIDLKAVAALRELSQNLVPLMDALSDSLTLSASEAYQGALVFYNTVKAATKVKAPNASSIYDDLSSRFPGRPSLKKAAGA